MTILSGRQQEISWTLSLATNSLESDRPESDLNYASVGVVNGTPTAEIAKPTSVLRGGGW